MHWINVGLIVFAALMLLNALRLTGDRPDRAGEPEDP